MTFASLKFATLLIAILANGNVVFTTRLKGDPQQLVALLQSPLYEPLSEIAVQVKKIRSAASQLPGAGAEKSDGTLRFTLDRIARLEPMIQHVLLLASSNPDEAHKGTNFADLAASFNSLRRGFMQAHSIARQLRSKHEEAGNESAHRLMGDVLRGLKRALHHASNLHPVLLVGRQTNGGDNALQAFLPLEAEMAHLKKGLEDLRHRKLGATQNHIEETRNRWARANSAFETSVAKLNGLVEGMTKSATGDEQWEKYGAARQLLFKTGNEKDSQRRQLEERLATVSSALNDFVNKKQTGFLGEASKGSVPLHKALSLVNAIEQQAMPLLQTARLDLMEAKDTITAVEKYLERRRGSNKELNASQQVDTTQRSSQGDDLEEPHDSALRSDRQSTTAKNADDAEVEDKLEAESEDEAQRTRDNLMHGKEPAAPKFMQQLPSPLAKSSIILATRSTPPTPFA